MASHDPTLPDLRHPGQASNFSAGLLLDGRYRLDRPLGEGGMGTLWVAHQLVLQREVVVKSLRIQGDVHQARLRQEALTLAAVRHPSIVQVFDLGETPWGVPYIVMEFIHGESLASRLDREGPLPAREAVALVLALLDGLTAAHAVGVIHRDLKPDNVLLARTSEGVQPKLVDFGIAQRDSAHHQLTEVGSIMGTPAFMAPEQIGGRPTDERTDVWGAASLLYSLLAGEPAFLANELMALLRKVMDDPPPYPRKAVGLDGRLWRILMDAMRKDPATRTGSARALRDELAGWLGGAARVGLSPDPPSERGAESPVISSVPPIPRGDMAPPSFPTDGARLAPETDTLFTMDALIQAKLEGA
jgi:serine/threonine protein kinase